MHNRLYNAIPPQIPKTRCHQPITHLPNTLGAVPPRAAVAPGSALLLRVKKVSRKSGVDITPEFFRYKPPAGNRETRKYHRAPPPPRRPSEFRSRTGGSRAARIDLFVSFHITSAAEETGPTRFTANNKIRRTSRLVNFHSPARGRRSELCPPGHGKSSESLLRSARRPRGGGG